MNCVAFLSFPVFRMDNLEGNARRVICNSPSRGDTLTSSPLKGWTAIGSAALASVGATVSNTQAITMAREWNFMGFVLLQISRQA